MNIYIYISKSHSPYLNQSIEHALVENQSEKEDILFLWLNKNAIIIGRNQNIFNEINEDYVKEKEIKIARRHSGGGAVYHDLGNILFSIIRNKNDLHSYENFLEPIVEFLKSLDVNAEFHGRNDVLVDGKKISGNAQFIIKDRMAHHGTLLFDTDLTVLGKSLITNKHKIETKGVKSNKQRVTNIKEHILQPMDSEEFLNQLAMFFVKHNKATINEIPSDILTAAENHAEMLSKYEWIYGKSPKATINNKIKYPGGNIEASLDVTDGKIANIQITGDFLSKKDVAEIYPILIGTKYTKFDIAEALKETELSDYFGTITLEELVNIISGK